MGSAALVAWIFHKDKKVHCFVCFKATKQTFSFTEPTSMTQVGIAQWLECWAHDWKVTGLSPCRSGRRIFFSRVNFLCQFLFWYDLLHPCVTAVAWKRSQSFCQKCSGRLQLDMQTPSVYMWLCTKWRGVCMAVHKTRWDGSSFVYIARAMSVLQVHHFGGYSKTCYKKLVTHVESHVSTVNLLESGE